MSEIEGPLDAGKRVRQQVKQIVAILTAEGFANLHNDGENRPHLESEIQDVFFQRKN
jgi:hypothetical protein